MPRLEVLAAGPEPAATDRPTLVLVHGAYHGAWSWEKVMPVLAARGYPCRAVSLRGHAGSEGRDRLNRAGFADFEADVESVLAGLPARPVLVGHSMGGLVVQRIVARGPDRFRGLVLVSSSPPTGLGVRQALGWLRTGPGLVLGLTRLQAGLLRSGAASTRSFPYRVFFAGGRPPDELRPYGERMQPDSVRASLQACRRVVPRIPERTPPVLVVGGEQDWFCPPAIAERTAAAWRTPLVRLPGSGHDLMLDAAWPDLAATVADFLDRLS